MKLCFVVFILYTLFVTKHLIQSSVLQKSKYQALSKKLAYNNRKLSGLPDFDINAEVKQDIINYEHAIGEMKEHIKYKTGKFIRNNK